MNRVHELNIKEAEQQGFLLISLEGAINFFTSGDFQRRLYKALEKQSVALDMSQVTMLSSSGLGVLIGAMELGKEHGCDLYIVNPSYPVQRALESTGFFDHFRTCEQLEDIEKEES